MRHHTLTLLFVLGAFGCSGETFESLDAVDLGQDAIDVAAKGDKPAPKKRKRAPAGETDSNDEAKEEVKEGEGLARRIKREIDVEDVEDDEPTDDDTDPPPYVKPEPGELSVFGADEVDPFQFFAGAAAQLPPLESATSSSTSVNAALESAWRAAGTSLGLASESVAAGWGAYRDVLDLESAKQRAIANQDAEALTIIGHIYGWGFMPGQQRNDAATVELWRLAANLRFAPAQCALGLMHFNGEIPGQPINKAEAARLLSLAVEQNYAGAQYNLGVMHSRGEIPGQPVNKAEAARLYSLAAKQNHATAQYNLGAMHHRGEIPGQRVNKAEAARLYSLAVKQNDAGAQVNLGVMHYNGEIPGQPVNKAEAARLYWLAAKQNDAMAQTNLGAMHYKGEIPGQPVNKAEAARLYWLAVKQNHATAQLNLGAMHHWGGIPGQPANQVEAYRLISLAAGQRDMAAQRMMHDEAFLIGAAQAFLNLKTEEGRATAAVIFQKVAALCRPSGSQCPAVQPTVASRKPQSL
jgi:TPR repeat protein